ncbi:hypothetical protein [Anabaena sp. PCC 7938]|uniref:Uncharacterized protein n=2 Tax=Nostocaceae TaxID=1162 RepID=K9ZJG8_ANACC|nr:hypothetical protein [Anabaena sp. CCAP 1446/1C]AFZ59346.1 hypothetical protein Anacy_3975 [Anabaena cylindrica PCC 7122]MCM2405265.1 hypothetical protein [Anabaena sp. CCAP 1446/1C]BAY03616.1 hypothetical protein NIES19_28700 [Anabaena cylindrica PCC 7122]
MGIKADLTLLSVNRVKGVIMSIAAVKTYNLRRIIVTLVSGVGTAMIFSGCGNSFLTSKITWETYHNPRYGFEFPYPSNWNSSTPPDNNDGVTFISPQNQNTEIRAWASKELPESIIQDQETIKQIDHNFETDQGVSGVMVVEVGQQMSSMKLTITQGQVTYYWQGQSNSKEFRDHYRLFYYIAQQYKIR